MKMPVMMAITTAVTVTIPLMRRIMMIGYSEYEEEKEDEEYGVKPTRKTSSD